MIEALSFWGKQIIMVVMFAAFVDFLIPENKFSKYIKVFLGLIVMLAIINPLLVLLSADISFKDIQITSSDIVDESKLFNMSELLKEQNNKIMIKQYKEQVEEYLTRELKSFTSYDVKTVVTEVDEENISSDLGRITKLWIVLIDKQEDSDVKLDEGQIWIDPVEIDHQNGTSQNTNIEKNKEIEMIKEYFQIRYDIPKNNIQIELGG